MITRHRFDLEIRVLIEEPLEGIFRLSCLETRHVLTVCGSWNDGARFLHDVIMHECRHCEQIFRAAPAGLLAAWKSADFEEQAARDSGVTHRGALPRIIHVMTERSLVESA